MTNELPPPYTEHLEKISRMIIEEIDYWTDEGTDQVRTLLRTYLGRSGKRYRPLLALLFADLYGGCLEPVYSAAAAIEIYHTATILFDDIQDNAMHRRGLPTAHVATSVSIGINLAGVARSLMYHPVYRSIDLTPLQKLELHRLLDRVATVVPLGQSMEIGWNAGWYASPRDFPFLRMIEYKTAALFSCAASAGAYLAGAGPGAVQHADRLGREIGVLFQMVDDYLDFFGPLGASPVAGHEDLREGKLTYPLILLLERTAAIKDAEQEVKILNILARGRDGSPDWGWLRDCMHAYAIEHHLRQEFRNRADRLHAMVADVGSNNYARRALHAFIDRLTAPIGPEESDGA